ncbi:MAG: Ig-like domain-containing protein [Devosia sp.]
MTVWNVSTAAQLNEALASAQGGDEIVLAPGRYGSIEITNQNFGSYVTIRSEIASNPAQFDRIEIDNSSFIRIDSVKVAYPSNPSFNSAVGLVDIENGSDHITLINSEIRGPIDGNFDGGRGVSVEQSTNVIVKGNFIHNIADGAVFLGASDIEIVENKVEDIRTDSFKFAGVQDVLIENNTGASRYYGASGDHQDFIQFSGSSSDVVIRGNVLLPAVDATVQGIFLDDGVYNNVLIEQNIIVNDLLRGIFVRQGSNVTVNNNTLISIPGSNLQEDGSSKASVITVPSGSSVFNNVTSHNVNFASITGSNIVMQHKDPNGVAYYDDLYVNATKGLGMTIEDLRPVAGSPVDFGSGKGAEARILELLDGGGPSDPPANADPIAGDDSASTEAGVSVEVNVLANDTDADGDAPRVVGFSNGANGSVGPGPGDTLIYQPDAGFVGVDTFDYTVGDGKGGTDAGTVTVTVEGSNNPVNTPPVATDDQAGVVSGAAVEVDVLANDQDADGDGIEVTGFTDGANGTVRLSGNGNLVYEPNSGFVGSDTFDYTVADTSGATDSARVTVTVRAPPDDKTDVDTLYRLDGRYTIKSAADVIVVPHSDVLATDAATIALTFEASSVDGRYGILSKDASGMSGGGNHFTAHIHDGSLKVRFQGDTDGRLIRVDGIEANRAYDLQVSFGDGKASVYLDGQLQKSIDFDMDWTDNVQVMQVGALGWASASGDSAFKRPFDGVISDVVIVDGVQSVETMQDVLGTDTEPPTEDRLLFALDGPLEVQGTSDVEIVPHSPALEISEGTVVLTFNADDASQSAGLLTKDASYYEGGGNHLRIYIKGGDLIARFQDDDSSLSFKFKDIEPNRDYDVVATFGGGDVALYVDGNLVGSGAFDMNWEENVQFMQIGADGSGSASGAASFNGVFDGTISDVAIFGDVIPPQDVELF